MFTPTDIQVNATALLQSVKNIQLGQDRYDSMLKLDINQPTDSFYYDAWQLKPEYRTPDWLRLFDQLGPVGQAKIVAYRQAPVIMLIQTLKTDIISLCRVTTVT